MVDANLHTATLNARWAQSLVTGLVAGGAMHAVVSPGSRNTPIVLAFERAAREGGLTIHTILDERSAAFFALGLARVTGAPTLISCTSGSAGAHYLPAVMEADLSAVPLVLMTADRPPELHGCGAPQTAEQGQLYGTHVRHTVDLGAPQGEALASGWLRTVATQLLDGAVGARPGPVHVNLPFRKPLWIEGVGAVPDATAPTTRVWRGPTALGSRDLDHLADLLRDKPRGVFVCGPARGGLADPDSEQPLPPALTRLAQALQWPILAETPSGLRFGLHDLHGIIAHHDAVLASDAAAEGLAPDLIVQIGSHPTSKATTGWMKRHGQDRTLLVDPDGRWQDPAHLATNLVISDPARLCGALADRLEGRGERPDGAWLDRWRRADALAQDALNGETSQGFWQGSITRALVGALPDGALLHVANSMPIRNLDRYCPVIHRDIRVAASRGLNGIDGTLSTALGEAAAWCAPTALLTGDLAFLHDAHGLVVAREITTPVTVVVVDNQGGGIFDHLPIAEHRTAFEPFFITPQGVDIPAYAGVTGLPVSSVDTTDGLRHAVGLALERPGVSIIHAPIDRHDDLRRHTASQRAATAAIAALFEVPSNPSETRP